METGAAGWLGVGAVKRARAAAVRFFEDPAAGWAVPVGGFEVMGRGLGIWGCEAALVQEEIQFGEETFLLDGEYVQEEPAVNEERNHRANDSQEHVANAYPQ